MHGVICAGVILSVMGAAFFFYVLCAPHPWPVCLVCAGTDWLVPKSPVAFHTLGLGLLPVCITPSLLTFFYALDQKWIGKRDAFLPRHEWDG